MYALLANKVTGGPGKNVRNAVVRRCQSGAACLACSAWLVAVAACWLGLGPPPSGCPAKLLARHSSCFASASSPASLAMVSARTCSFSRFWDGFTSTESVGARSLMEAVQPRSGHTHTKHSVGHRRITEHAGGAMRTLTPLAMSSGEAYSSGR